MMMFKVEDWVEKISNDKIIKYETFLSDQLRPDLENVLQERDKLYAEIAEFLALKNSIEAIKAIKRLKQLN